MGKTVPTIAVIMQQEKAALKNFRAALPKNYQRAFDELWIYVAH
jgi:hypothetical protein